VIALDDFSPLPPLSLKLEREAGRIDVKRAAA
jgi:hypothetical protein